MEKRILIKEDSELFIEIAKDLKQFIPVLNELKSSYENLEIGVFSNEAFQQIILAGPTAHIEKYVKSLSDQLDKLGITNQIMRQNAIKNHENIIEEFKNAIVAVKRFIPETYTANRPKLAVKFISVDNNGLFHIDKDSKELILETYCRVYVEGEDLKNLELVQNLQKNFNEYLSLLKENGIQGFNKYLLLGNVFSINNEGLAEINAEGVKAIATYKKRFKEFVSK